MASNLAARFWLPLSPWERGLGGEVSV
jgi:hypothetical protein